MILHGQETRPDSTKHHPHGISPIHGLNSEPEDGQYSPRDDGDIGTPEPPARSRKDGKGGMVDDAGGAVERDDDGDDEEADGDDGDGLSPTQTDGDDAAGELPCGRIECITYPVRNEA